VDTVDVVIIVLVRVLNLCGKYPWKVVVEVMVVDLISKVVEDVLNLYGV